MPVAQGIVKQTVIKKQTALGSAASGAGGQVLRRKSSVFNAQRDTFEADEIVTHQQSTGVAYGVKKPSGKIDGLLSPATYGLFLAAALRKDFAAGVSIASLSLTIATSGAAWTVTRGSGSFLTGLVKVGDVIQLSVGSLNAANISKNLLVIALTATVATVVPLNGVALVAEGPIATCTVTVIGKKSIVPLTAHTNDYFTVEEWYSDLSRSETFVDTKVGKVDIELPATGNASVGFELMGRSRTLGAAQVLTSPTSETVTGIMSAVNGLVYANGAVVANCTGVQISIDGGVAHGEAVVGSNSVGDISRGRVKVSGSFTALFDAVTLQSLYDAETPISLIVPVTVDESATSSFMCFTMGKIKLTGDAPDDGEKQIVRTYPFTAEINDAGGTSLAWDQTILTIQDGSL